MITIAPSDADSAEAIAAQELRSAALAADPSLLETTEAHLVIVPSAKLFLPGTRDVDLLVMYYDFRDRAGLYLDPTTSVRNFIAVIELKQHSAERVKLQGQNKVHVAYRGGHYADASEQSERQKHALREVILKTKNLLPNTSNGSGSNKSNYGNSDLIFITNAVWLRNVARPEVWGTSNVIFGLPDWASIVRSSTLGLRQVPWTERESALRAIKASRPIAIDTHERLYHFFARSFVPTSLDRRRVESISASVTKSEHPKYTESLGTKSLIFRGRGGTGKTMRLLQLAAIADEHQGKRVLLLTYNLALLADVTRLLVHARIRGGADRGVHLQSVHQHFRSWLVALELLPSRTSDMVDDEFFELYDTKLEELRSLANSGALNQLDIQTARSANRLSLDFDLVLIDEGQDWLPAERDLITRLFPAGAFVVSDGVDQMIRAEAPTEWRPYLAAPQVVSLTKSLRMKSALATFAQAFAASRHLHYNWEIKPQPELPGGRVVVIIGSRGIPQDIFTSLIAQHRDAGNKLIDVLCCVPSNPKYGVHPMVSWLRENDYEVWDGTDIDERRFAPRSADAIRLVKYESCRGLEGWTVFCAGLDDLFDEKLKKTKLLGRGDLLSTIEELALQAAAQWSMIPITRAVDTLILHVRDSKHLLAKVLRELADEYDFIQLHER